MDANSASRLLLAFVARVEACVAEARHWWRRRITPASSNPIIKARHSVIRLASKLIFSICQDSIVLSGESALLNKLANERTNGAAVWRTAPEPAQLTSHPASDEQSVEKGNYGPAGLAHADNECDAISR